MLLLDEPAAGLSATDKARARALLRRIAEAGIAVVLVEHDMSVVMGISDRVVVLDAGVRIAAGTPAEVQRDPAVRKAYLGEEAGARAQRTAAAALLRCSRSAGSRPAMARSRCCRASTSTCATARWSRCSARTAPASRR